MDTNLGKKGINQKKKEKIKVTTTKANIHDLLNILKTYYANTHQDTSKPVTEGTEGLKLMIDTRQTLGKRPPYTNQNGTKTLPVKGKHTKRQDYEGVYPQPRVTQAPQTRPYGATTMSNNSRPPLPEEGQIGSPKTTRLHITNVRL